MNTQLKKAIVLWIFENEKQFSLHNAASEKFRPYIYDASGEFLIGGEVVSEFIGNFIKIMK
jgi:hypothetical protein